VVPLAAELVVGDHDQRVPGVRAGLDGLDQVDQVPAAGVLVLLADGLDEAHRLQPAGLRRGDELDLVAQVRGAGGGAGRVVGEVVERLVVVLERGVRAGMSGISSLTSTFRAKALRRVTRK
jgi:hypothetical protein